MKVIDPGDYDVDAIRFAVSALANGLWNNSATKGDVFTGQFTSGTRELIRLAVDVLEDAWRGEGVSHSAINFFRNC